MGVEFGQRETPNAAQRRATEHFTGVNQFAYALGGSLAFGCALFSGWAAYKIAGNHPSGMIFAIAAGFIDYGKTFAIVQWGSFRSEFGRDPFWMPIAQLIFFCSVVWSVMAVFIFTYYTQNLAWGFILSIAQVMATVLPGFGVHGGKTWEETKERRVIYTHAGAAQIEAEALPVERQIRRADQIAAEAIEWLWPGMIPAGDFTIIGGESTAGKTTVCMSLAAAVSSGGKLPDGTRAPHGVAAVIEAEDDVASVTRPRLEAAGADLSRVHIIEHSGGEILTPEILEEYATRIRGLRFLVLSPLRILMQDNQAPYQKIWSRLNPIVQWARARGVAIIGVMHPPKNSKDSLAGSDAYRSLARSILYADSDPDKPGIRRLKLLISNIAATPPAFPYRIVSADLGGIETSRIIWLSDREKGGMLEESRVQAVGGNVISMESRRVQTGHVDSIEAAKLNADSWLRQQLRSGPKLLQDLLASGEREGYPRSTLFNASNRIGVVSNRAGRRNVTWRLPE